MDQTEDKAADGVHRPGRLAHFQVRRVRPEAEAGQAHPAALLQPVAALGDGGDALPGDFGTGTAVALHAPRQLRRQKGALLRRSGGVDDNVAQRPGDILLCLRRGINVAGSRVFWHKGHIFIGAVGDEVEHVVYHFVGQAVQIGRGEAGGELRQSNFSVFEGGEIEHVEL